MDTGRVPGSALRSENAGWVPGIPTRTKAIPAPERSSASRRAWLPSHRVAGRESDFSLALQLFDLVALALEQLDEALFTH